MKRNLISMALAAGSPPLPASSVYQNGTGAITINGRDIDDYFGLETLKLHRPSAPGPH